MDKGQLAKTDQLPEEVQAYDLPPDIVYLINTSNATYSKPMEVKHNLHIEVDPDEPLGLKGLTEEMKQLLAKCGIDKNEIMQDPVAYIQIMEHLDGEVIEQQEFPKTKEFLQQVQKVVFNEENPATKYKFTDQLGKGASCKVYRAVDRGNSSVEYAVRVMKLVNPQMIGKIKTEIALMQTMSHPNLVKYHDSYLYQGCL